jgi:squalene-hopene/tetraprenyl-beta-curcumene cyclase
MLEQSMQVASEHRSTSSQRRASERSVVKPRTSALDLAIDRTQGWCRIWWARIHHGTAPWLVAIPDIGPTCEVLLADALFHDLRTDEREPMLAWIRSQQHADGSWHDAGNRPDLSLTCLAWWALVQHGADADEPALERALRVVHELGGARRANLTVRLWLAMAGVVPWDWVPAVPAELYLLPEYMPLSPARLSPWARQMVTALHLLASGPARVHVCEVPQLLLHNRWDQPIPPRLTSHGLAGDLLQAFDKTIKLARTLPRGAFHRRSLARAQRWIDATQQAHGGWFSMRPTLYSLLALRVAGARSDDPRVRRGLDYLRRARGVV